MNTFFIKIIFLVFTLAIFLYASSYASYEITKKNNMFGGVFIFFFNLACVIFSNIIFFTT